MPALRSAYLKLSIVVLFFALHLQTTSNATPPQTITFQGRVTDSTGAALVDGAYIIRLAIYDAQVGGNILWDAGEQAVLIKGGLFTYVIGSSVSLPVSLFSEPDRFLGITVGSDNELAPRIRFQSSPYALEASHADSSKVAALAHSSLTAIQSDTSDFSQLAALALASNSSTVADSAGLADSAKIAADANSLAGMSPGFYLDWNSINNMPAGFADGVDDGAAFSAGAGLQLVGGEFSITASGVTEQLIADNAITATKIAASSVGSSEVQNNSLTTVDLAANSVASSEIVDNTVTQDDMAPNSIGASELIAGAIDSTKISDSSITGAQIAPNSIGVSHLQSGSFSSTGMLDEPGVAQITGASFLTVPSLITVSSLSITAPANGYVMALASFEMKVDHIFGTASQAIVGLSNTSAALPGDQNKNVDIPSSANAGTFTSIVSLQRIFPVSAGVNTFYLLGRKTTSASPIWSTFDVTFSLVYYSTAYGTVSTIQPETPQPPSSK